MHPLHEQKWSVVTRPPAAPAAEATRIPLTRERVLRAAIDLADREGVDAISMRRLGAELGVEAMSLYNHVPNKAALLDGIVETIVNDIDFPEDVSDWQECVREMARAYRQVANSHPNLVPIVATRPFNTIGSLRPIEVAFKIFDAAGFSPQTAVYAFRALAALMTGYSIAENTSFYVEGADDWGEAMVDMPEDAFPHLAKVAPHFAAIDQDAAFDFAIDVVLTGLETKLHT